MPVVDSDGYRTLTLSREGRVLTVRFADPPLSYVTPELIADLERLTLAVDRDDSVGAVVLTGAVDGRFLTHADPITVTDFVESGFPRLPVGGTEAVLRILGHVLRVPGLADLVDKHGGVVGRNTVWAYRWKRVNLRLNRSSTVYLAAINGPTMGGGHELVLACDLRYVADSADIRLGQFESQLGLVPGGGGTQRLPRMVGTARAIEHMLEGRTLSAREALDLGVVHRVVEPEQLLAQTQRTAARLALRSPTAIRGIKRAVYFGTSRRPAHALSQEAAAFIACLVEPAARRMTDAFAHDAARFGDTPILSNPKPWEEGTRVDFVSTDIDDPL